MIALTKKKKKITGHSIVGCIIYRLINIIAYLELDFCNYWNKRSVKIKIWNF